MIRPQKEALRKGDLIAGFISIIDDLGLIVTALMYVFIGFKKIKDATLAFPISR